MLDDVLIIGGGVIGLSLAYELSTHGLRIRLIDRQQLGREASWAGAGILPAAGRENLSDPYEQLRARSAELHPIWAASLREQTGVDTGYRACGGLYVARSADAAASLETASSYWQYTGVTAEQVEPRRIKDVEPTLGLGADEIASCYWVPGEAQLRNPWHLRAMEIACRQRGVTIDPGTPAEALAVRGDTVTGVVTGTGFLEAGAVCVAGGAWSRALLSSVGAKIAVRPVRGQMVLLRTTGPIPRCVVNDGLRYVVPRDDGRVLVGSTEEEAGFDKRTTTDGVAGLLEFGRALVPSLGEAEFEAAWAGLRPASERGTPYLGRIGELTNAYVATGHFRSGLFLSPGTAEVMGQLIRGATPSIELAAFTLEAESRN